MWKKFLFTLLVAVGFFAGLELLLAVFGVRPVLETRDPYVGFSSYAPVFVEQPADDGSVEMVTSPAKLEFFNQQQFPKNNAEGAVRVFCMGGSTTAGRPYDDTTSFCGWLRAFLDQADSRQQWQLVNCGALSYASYRVARLMEELAQYEPDLFIVYTGNNEFQEERTYRNIIRMPGAWRDLHTLAASTRTYAVLERLAGIVQLEESSPQNVLGDDPLSKLDVAIGPAQYHRDDAQRQAVLEHFRFNLHRMVDIADRAGVPIVLVAPGIQLRDCAPFKSEHRQGLTAEEEARFETLQERAESAFRQGKHAQALAGADEALAIDSRYAHLHYLRGRIFDALHRYGEAKTSYVRAAQEDICPLRALPETVRIVREMARERGIPLVDFEEIVEAQAAQGIPGAGEFLDHVHPTIESHRLLALDVLKTLEEENLLSPSETWNEQAIQAVTQQVMDKIDDRYHAYALRNLSLLLGWAGKDEESHRLALKTVEMAPEFASGHATLADSHRHLRQWKKAIEHYRRALWLDPESLHAANGLAWILATCEDESLRRPEEALRLARYCTEVTDYENFRYLHTLAAAHAATGNYEQAAHWEEQVLEKTPSKLWVGLKDQLEAYRAGKSKPERIEPTSGS